MKETRKQAVIDEPTTPVSYPHRLKKNNFDKQFTKFMEVFKKLHINIPFTDALEQMPSYVKFMKIILLRKIRLSNFETVNLILLRKRRLSDFETVNLTKEGSAIL